MKSVSLAKRAVLPLAVSILAAVGQGAEARQLKPYRAEGFERVIVPSNANDYVGRTIRLTTDQKGMAYVFLGYRFIAINRAPINAVVGGIPFSVPRGSLFTRRAVKGGRIAELPADALILCQREQQRNFGQSLASAATLGLTQIATRYMENVQLCGVDADRDGALEKLFLVGAKQAQDLDLTTILPVPYDYRQNEQVDDYRLIIHLQKILFSGPALVVDLQGPMAGRIDGLRFESSGSKGYTWPAYPIKKSKLPQEIRIGSAILVVKAYDEPAGTADVKFTKFFDNETVGWSYQRQTITIYVPR